MSCDLPGTGAFAAAWEPPAAQRASLQRKSGDGDITGSIPPAAAESAESAHLPPDLAIQHSKLFSAAEDRKPWPFVGSPEAKKQNEEDEKREREIARDMHICNC